jgi:phenylpyruvate tautomerase PptA (4-oxalocrotonate tautomerase family)
MSVFLIPCTLDKVRKSLSVDFMPLLKVYSSNNLSSSIYEPLSSSLTSTIATTLGKSEDFIMVIFQHTIFQSFGSNAEEPSVYIEFKNVGNLSPDVTTRLSGIISELFEKFTDLDPSRMYIEFQPTERHLWGWNGKTLHISE